jgi:ABC-2 type transport system permease protein
MSTLANTAPESPKEAPAVEARPLSPTRPLYWSVRREVWENRSISLAPLAAAAVFLLGFAFSTFGLPDRRRGVLLLEPAQQRAAIEKPYDVAAMMIMVTAILVGVFYCLDALHGERRDRSILFWKSLPVSDLTAVLAKASIPLAVLPLLTFAITLATQLAMLLLSTAILLVNGLPPATWRQLPLLESSLVQLYGLVVLALWHAPIYGWLLLVSGWARRATVLWAVLPPLALVAVEKAALDTSHVASFLGYRLVGGVARAFAFGPRGGVPVESLAQLTPGRFLTSPGLWLGLLAAAAFLAAATRLRRHREPI